MANRKRKATTLETKNSSAESSSSLPKELKQDRSTSSPCRPLKRARKDLQFNRTLIRELDQWCNNDSKTLSQAFIKEATKQQQQLSDTNCIALKLFRGLCLPKHHRLLQHVVGDKLMLKQTEGPSSWTTNQAVAVQFAGIGTPIPALEPGLVEPPHGGIVLETTVPPCQVIIDIRRLCDKHKRLVGDEESEVILHAGEFPCAVIAVQP
jgi:hypothetical protein